MTVLTAKKPFVDDDYFELVKRFPLVPIKSASHLKAAFKVIDKLSILDEEKLTTAQADYLIVLTDLVERFESQTLHQQHAFNSGIDVLAYLVGQHDMSASDLGRILGNRQLGAAILRGDRQLSKQNVVQLADHFSVSTDLFLRRSAGSKS